MEANLHKGPNYFEFMSPNQQISQLLSLVSCNLPVQQKQEVSPSTFLLPCEMLSFCRGNLQSTIETVFWESKLLYFVDSKSSLPPFLVKDAFSYLQLLWASLTSWSSSFSGITIGSFSGRLPLPETLQVKLGLQRQLQQWSWDVHVCSQGQRGHRNSGPQHFCMTNSLMSLSWVTQGLLVDRICTQLLCSSQSHPVSDSTK